LESWSVHRHGDPHAVGRDRLPVADLADVAVRGGQAEEAADRRRMLHCVWIRFAGYAVAVSGVWDGGERAVQLIKHAFRPLYG